MTSPDYRVLGKSLEVAGKACVEFDHPVSDVVRVNDVLVVALDVMARAIYPRNVFGVSITGQILWQIPDLQPNEGDSPYVGLVALSDSVLANRWDDFHVWLEPLTGKVLKQEWSRS